MLVLYIGGIWCYKSLKAALMTHAAMLGCTVTKQAAECLWDHTLAGVFKSWLASCLNSSTYLSLYSEAAAVLIDLCPGTSTLEPAQCSIKADQIMQHLT